MLALSCNTIAPSLENDLRYLKWPVAVTFLLYPAFALNLQKGANVCFYLLVLFSLIGIASGAKPIGLSFAATCRKYYIHPAVIDAYSDGSLFPVMHRGEEQHTAYSGLGLRPEEYCVMVLVAEYQ